MKKAYVVALCVLLLLVSACAQKVNDPGDVKAVKDLLAGYPKADMNKDVAFFESTYYTDDAIRLQPNGLPVRGKEEIVKWTKNNFANYTQTDILLGVDEVLSSGDLAVARGTYTGTSAPKASDLPANSDPSKWVGVYKRQPDGSWKCAFDIWNSDAPTTGATADGAEEQALYQILRDWGAAYMKKDAAAVDKILAKEFTGSLDGRPLNKAQVLAMIRSNPAKLESGGFHNMTAMVFGKTAIVHGAYSVKSTTNGKDSSMKGQFTDVFVKRDGRWQCVTDYDTSLK